MSRPVTIILIMLHNKYLDIKDQGQRSIMNS